MATLEINDAEAGSNLLFLGLLVFNAAVWTFATVFWIPTEGFVDAGGIRTLVGALASINLLASLAVLRLQARASKLKSLFKKTNEVDPKQFDLMT